MTHRLPTWIGADVPRWAISPVQAAFLERFPAGAVVVAGVQVHGDVLGQRCRSLSASRVSASRAWSTVLAVADTACATSRGTTGAACPRTGFSVMARRPAIVQLGDTIPVVLACGVPDSRPVTGADAARIRAAVNSVRKAQEKLEKAVALALQNGASVRAVAELGVSPNTAGARLAHRGEPRAVLRVPLRP
jgi:hypothetical protein